MAGPARSGPPYLRRERGRADGRRGPGREARRRVVVSQEAIALERGLELPVSLVHFEQRSQRVVLQQRLAGDAETRSIADSRLGVRAPALRRGQSSEWFTSGASLIIRNGVFWRLAWCLRRVCRTTF